MSRSANKENAAKIKQKTNCTILSKYQTKRNKNKQDKQKLGKN